MKLDVLIPTKNSENVIRASLSHLYSSVERSDASINKVMVSDSSNDNTPRVIKQFSNNRNWNLEIEKDESSLPEARQKLINRASTEWFLFLDDDVMIDRHYLDTILQSISPAVGAIQGKKRSSPYSASIWVHRRSLRGGTHCTLIRSAAVDGINIPSDLSVMEDEYIRRFVEEKKDYIWLFNHQAYFEHKNQERHTIGWEQGYLEGKYDLKDSYRVKLDILASIKSLNKPLGYFMRLAGYYFGRYSRLSDKQF